jgi:hypothetical protein
MAFVINFERNNAELSGIGHRVYGLSSANDFPLIFFVHFRGVFPYISLSIGLTALVRALMRILPSPNGHAEINTNERWRGTTITARPSRFQLVSQMGISAV